MKVVNLSYELAQRSFASQNKRELEILLEILFKTDPKVILEIGVARGGSIKTWREAFPKAWIIGVDNDIHATSSYCNEFWFENSASVYEPVSKSVAEQGGVDFLFIDGDHTENGCQSDFNLYSPLVKKGGIIAFHDACLKDHPSVEVYKVWDKIKEFHNYEEFHFEGGTGTGVLFV